MSGYPRPAQFGIDRKDLPKELRKEMTDGEMIAGNAVDAAATSEILFNTYASVANKAGEAAIRGTEGQ